MPDDETKRKHRNRNGQQPPDLSTVDVMAGLVTVANVQAEEIHWIWPGRLAIGKVHVADGEPGLGKSLMFGAEIPAMITTGRPLPGMDTANIGPTDVLILSNEDGIADTIRPRAEAAGADLERLHVLKGVPVAGKAQLIAPKLPTDHRLIEQIINRLGVGMLVIDVLSSFIEKGLNQNVDADMRTILDPLAGVAERTGCSIVVLRHPNKRSGAQALDRGSGAVGIGGAARVVLMFGWHPDDSEIEDRNQRRRAMAVSKVNVAAYAPTIAYSVRAEPTLIEIDGIPEMLDVPRVHWHGNIAATADDLVGAEGSNNAGEHDDAATFLRRVLEDGPMLADHVMKEGKEAGFNSDQLKRAKKRARVTSDKQPGILNGKWFWTLKSGS